MISCFAACHYNVVVVRRELLLFFDYGGVFMDRFLLSINSHCVLDFDDDIGKSKREPRDISFFGKMMLEHPAKFRTMLKTYSWFSTGPADMIEILRPHHPEAAKSNTYILPMCIEMHSPFTKNYSVAQDEIVFGWIGQTAKLNSLKEVVSALEIISKEINVRLIVLSGAALDAAVSFPVENIRWSLENETAQMQRFDIGLAPYQKEEEKTASGSYKLIQYMSLGLITISTDVKFIQWQVRNGVDGFILEENNWEKTIRTVLSKKNDWSKIGSEGQNFVKGYFTFEAHLESYATFLKRVAGS